MWGYDRKLDMVTILYFARLREALGKASEQLSLPQGVGNVASLRQVLASRGGSWALELAQSKNVRMAVNQDMADSETPIRDGDEVAFFPPVTGG
jgi:molybdopterin synthase sulfur carrier subunit